MTNQIVKKSLIMFLVLMIGLGSTPAFSYAKENGKNKREDRKERVERQDRRGSDRDDDEDDDDINRSCIRAFGHLIAPGFVRKHGRITISENCFLPFGIHMKFFGIASTTIPTPIVDTQAPIISNIAVRPNTVKAKIVWRTDERSDTTVFWSATSSININSTSTLSKMKNELVRNHEITIDNLTASTTYFLIIRSRDASSNTATSSEISFKTKSLAEDSNPPVISTVTLLVGTSTAKWGWKTNEPATSKVYYGSSINLDINATSTAFVENIALTENHSISINGLTPSAQYYSVIESKDAVGNRTTTPVFSFFTLATSTGL